GPWQRNKTQRGNDGRDKRVDGGRGELVGHTHHRAQDDMLKIKTAVTEPADLDFSRAEMFFRFRGERDVRFGDCFVDVVRLRFERGAVYRKLNFDDHDFFPEGIAAAGFGAATSVVISVTVCVAVAVGRFGERIAPTTRT